MSAVVERRDEHLVILRYETALSGPHHAAQRVYPSDRLRMAILRSERELRNIETMIEALEDSLSDVAVGRFSLSIRTVSAALGLARHELAAGDAA